jgi:hypothetical protein
MNSNNSSEVDITSNINLFHSQHKSNNSIVISLYKMLYPKECLLRDLIFNMSYNHYNISSRVANINNIHKIEMWIFTLWDNFISVELYPNIYTHKHNLKNIHIVNIYVRYIIYINNFGIEFLFDTKTNLSEHIKCDHLCSNKNPIDDRLIGEINKIMNISYQLKTIYIN